MIGKGNSTCKDTDGELKILKVLNLSVQEKEELHLSPPFFLFLFETGSYCVV